MDKTEIKLGDFGLADKPSEEGKVVGTVRYLPPEIIRFQRYWVAVDVWALGVILYRLISGKFPFDGTNQKEILNKIKHIDYDQKYMPSNCSKEVP